MYIEFCYRVDSPDTYYYLLEQTRLRLSQWSRLYDIQFQQKTHKNCLRLCFFQDQFYEFFMMTFDRGLLDYTGISMRLITDPNNRK